MVPAKEGPVVEVGDGGEVYLLGVEWAGGVEADVDVEAWGG